MRDGTSATVAILKPIAVRPCRRGGRLKIERVQRAIRNQKNAGAVGQVGGGRTKQQFSQLTAGRGITRTWIPQAAVKLAVFLNYGSERLQARQGEIRQSPA
jgi:hypothetical protein